MTKEVSVSKLLRRSVAQRLSWKSFNSLINQLESRNPVSDNEYTTSLLSLETDGSSALVNKEFNDFRINLVLHLSLFSISQLTKFWKNLSRIDPLSQITYLKRLDLLLNQEYGSIDNNILTNLVNVQSKEYTFAVLGGLKDSAKPSKDQQLLVHYLIFFLANLIDNFHSKDTTMQEFIVKLLKVLQKLKNHKLFQFLYKKTEAILSEEKLDNLETEDATSLSKHNASGSIGLIHKLDHSASQTSSSIAYKSLAPSSLPPGLLSGYQEMKQFLWFSKIMKDFKFENNEIMLNNFIANFCAKKSHYEIASQLLQCCFSGYSHSVTMKDYSYMIFNWKNFIVSRLPPILSNLKFTSGSDDETLEKAIEVVFESLDEKTINNLSTCRVGSTKPYDLRHSFLKTCIFNKLVQPSIFQKLFPAKFKLVQQSLNQEFNQFNQELNLQQSFNEKLLNVNTEFTSLEESGLIEFMSTLPSALEFSFIKQLELGKIITTIMEDLINYQDQEKLSRLFLALFGDVQLVNLVIFNSNPLAILKKLIDYADKDCFKLEDEDDERFQEIYSYFGVVLLGITLIIDTFKIDFSKLSIQNSFTISYLKDFHYSLCDSLTNSAIKNNDNSAGNSELTSSNDESIVANFNNLMSDWINALFDESNDGLSDDLIKSINIKQIYKLIPLIYQQSIIATKSNVINFEILSNGIDYLSQVFLVPCTLSIIQWLLGKVSLQKDLKDTLYLDILHSIIKSNYGGELNEDDNEGDDDDLNMIGSGDENTEKRPVQEIPQIIFKIVINICGSNILNTAKSFPDRKGSKVIKQIIKMVNSLIDPNYAEQSVKVGYNFDINEGIKNYLSSFSKPESNSVKTPTEIEQNSFVQNYLIHNNASDQFLEFLIDETLSYQETNNDQSRLVIILSSFLVILTSIDSAEDKKHWRQVLSQKFIDDDQSWELDDSAPSSNSFKLTLDHHYASIFNDSEPSDELDVQIKNDEDEDMLDEDDLFNEKSFNITNFSKKSTSDTLDAIYSHTRIHDTMLGKFDCFRKVGLDDPSLVKCFKVLSESILDELNSLYV